MKYIVVKTTFEKQEEANSMANSLLESHLISCAQISEINSLYTWKGKTENTHEYILTMKSKKSLYNQIEKHIKQRHSYEIPQIIALPIIKGSKEYLNWINENVNGGINENRISKI